MTVNLWLNIYVFSNANASTQNFFVLSIEQKVLCWEKINLELVLSSIPRRDRGKHIIKRIHQYSIPKAFSIMGVMRNVAVTRAAASRMKARPPLEKVCQIPGLAAPPYLVTMALCLFCLLPALDLSLSPIHSSSGITKDTAMGRLATWVSSGISPSWAALTNIFQRFTGHYMTSKYRNSPNLIYSSGAICERHLVDDSFHGCRVVGDSVEPVALPPGVRPPHRSGSALSQEFPLQQLIQPSLGQQI